MITLDQLDQLGIDPQWLDPINDLYFKYDISTPLRQGAFIGQCQHESNNFRTLEENLHYSAGALMRVWPSRFPDMDTAEKYENNPEKIANKVYSGRMGNGLEESGDGYAFRGRGVIQLTGRDAYARCGLAIGLDLLKNPDLLLIPANACLSAGWFWNKLNLNALADSQDYKTMTQRINGGLNGLDDRVVRITKALTVLAS